MKKIVIVISILLLSASLFLWSGMYNIAANEKHWTITNELIEILRERSIEVRADDIIVPEDIGDKSRLNSAAINYQEMCSGCHLAPEGDITELHKGLYPQPPIFYKSEAGHDAHGKQNNFWVIKNGIKLTGMPAWGESHTDNEIWSLVAFVEQLNEMSAEEYKILTQKNNE